MEWAELEAIFSRKDVSAVKAFLTSKVDKFRPPFGKNTGSFPRHSLIVGTTNTDDFLQDPSGSRRFWIIPIAKDFEIKIDYLTKDRDELWAAALAAYERGDQWWLTKEEEFISENINKQFASDDSWTEVIANYIEYLEAVSVRDILECALKINIGDQEKSKQMRVAKILSTLGWEKFHTEHGKKWKRIEKNESKGSQVVSDIENTGFQADYPINKGSQNIKGSQASHTVTQPQYFSDKGGQPKVVSLKTPDSEAADYLTTKKEKSKVSFNVGDRVRIKSPHFLAGKTGEVMWVNPNDPDHQVTGGGDKWAVNQGFKFSQLERVK